MSFEVELISLYFEVLNLILESEEKFKGTVIFKYIEIHHPSLKLNQHKRT